MQFFIILLLKSSLIFFGFWNSMHILGLDIKFQKKNSIGVQVRFTLKFKISFGRTDMFKLLNFGILT